MHPRTVRLLRAPSLAAYQRAIVHGACTGDVSLVRATAVLVPTRAAAGQLQRTIEDDRLAADGTLLLPDILTRGEWYERLRTSLREPARPLSPYEREVILQAAAHEAITHGAVPPFHLRPALIGEMLDLYDELRRRQKQLDDFERLLVEELEPRAESDRGAERVLRQTRFLAAAFRSYEARIVLADGIDEHALRARLLEGAAAARYRRVILTVGDRTVDRSGLWPADVDLLVRLDGVEQVDVVATEAQLAAGFHERVHDLVPGLEEVHVEGDGSTFEDRVLVVPDGSTAVHFSSRDREEELTGVVRRVKAARREAPLEAARLDRTAVVFARPLPYVYLARSLFAGARVPFQCDDALPLAAEPGAAALDVLLAFVTSGASRAATIALLRSPHYLLGPAGSPVAAEAVHAFDQALAEVGYTADWTRLATFAADWPHAAGAADARVLELRRAAAHAARAAADAAVALAALFDVAPATVHLDTLRRFVLAHGVAPVGSDAVSGRLARSRTALLATLEGLLAAHRTHGDLNWTLDEVGASIRRWIEAQTFSPRAGEAGVHLVDAATARYGRFDEVHLVGLVEGEWPERQRRNLFYSPFLLRRLGWVEDEGPLAAARAAFLDLLRLPSRRVSVSTFLLEEDSLVEPSALLDELPRAGLQPRALSDDAVPVFATEALLSSPVPVGAIEGAASDWLRLRQARSSPAHPSFHGTVQPHRPRTHGVGSVELYAQCPFKYFARYVLRLEEDADDEEALSPRERGVFVHEVFEAFFAAWSSAGHGAITPPRLADARALLETVVEPLLARLSPSDAALERTRLLGSPVAPGLADIVLRMEAARTAPVVERRLEDRFSGAFVFEGAEGPREVPLRGVVDRIDLLGDGTLRVIDYKSSLLPQPMQLAVYAVTAAQRLSGYRGREWSVSEAAYIVFNAGRGVKTLGRRAEERAKVIASAQVRFVEAVEGIEAGVFPPRPAQAHLCASCAYAGVCRKDHVTQEADPVAAAAV